jgi:hypothetical protein
MKQKDYLKSLKYLVGWAKSGIGEYSSDIMEDTKELNKHKRNISKIIHERFKIYEVKK